MTRSVIVVLLCSLSIPAHALADNTVKHSINIAAQDLSSALEELSHQSGTDLVYRPEQVRGLKTRGAVGEMSTQDAVVKLLQGTRLKVSEDPSGALLIAAPLSASALSTTSESGQTSPPPDRSSLQLAQATPGQPSGPSTVEKQDEQSSDKKKEALEQVIVTGSRIPTAAGQLTVPVQIYTRDDVERSGQITVTDFLNTLSDVSTAYRADGFTTGFPGITTVQLHGLPVGTTLTLLDGQRMEESGSVGFVDLSNIPISAVERIEVLPVGASAIYGADALAGAVNIILRKDFDGFEINGRVGQAADVTDKVGNIAWGERWDRGSVSLMGIYQDLGPLLGGDRAPLAASAFPASVAPIYNTGDCAPGNVFSLNGTNLPGLTSPQAAIPPGITGKPTLQQFAGTAGKQSECDDLRYVDLLPASRNVGGLLSGHFSLSQSADLFTETMASHTDRWTVTQPAIDVPTFYGAVLGANNPYNPFGEDVGVSFANPSVPGPRDTITESLVRPLIGIRGSVLSDWHYEATAYFSRSQLEQDNPALNPVSVLNALESSNLATALNPFATGAPGPASLLQSLTAIDPANSSTTHEVDQVIAGEALLRGPLLSLPAGPLQAVLGVYYSHEKQDLNTDQFGTPLSSDLQRKSYAVFAETRTPLFLSAQGSQAGERLALTAAGRYDHSDDYGGKATWQSGLLWRPIDAVSFSASYGVSYEAPTLQELAGSQFSELAVTGAVDPYRGNQPVPNVQLLFGSNSKLDPETGDAITLGVKYSSEALPGLRASLTAYRISISNYIATPTFQDLIDYPTLYPGAVERAPPTAQDQQLGYLGQITQINDTYYNFGDLRVKGLDADASYAIQSNSGRWTPSLAVAYVGQWDSALTPNSPAVDYVSQANNVIAGGVGWAPRWKGTAALAWAGGPLSINVAGRYVGPYRDLQDIIPNSNELGNSWYVDVAARYELGGSFARAQWLSNAYVALTVVDLLDKTPPFSYGGTPYDHSQYDIRGRYVSVLVGLKL